MSIVPRLAPPVVLAEDDAWDLHPVISDEELNMLLDRSADVFRERGSGWDSKKGLEDIKADNVEKKRNDPKFAVYTGAAESGNEVLAGLLGEDVE